MKICSKCKLLKPKSEFHKRSRNKDGLCEYCKPCKSINASESYFKYSDNIKIKVKIYTSNNIEKVRATKRKYNKKNASHIAKLKREYSEKNAAKLKLYRARYYIENRDKALLRSSIYSKNNRDKCNKISSKYAKSHRPYLNDIWAKRRATQLLATPLWADFEKIKRIYIDASEKTKSTNIKYEVDHIVPLKSKLVCGLHCEANLQIITRTENKKKSNLYWPDMP